MSAEIKALVKRDPIEDVKLGDQMQRAREAERVRCDAYKWSEQEIARFKENLPKEEEVAQTYIDLHRLKLKHYLATWRLESSGYRRLWTHTRCQLASISYHLYHVRAKLDIAENVITDLRGKNRNSEDTLKKYKEEIGKLRMENERMGQEIWRLTSERDLRGQGTGEALGYEVSLEDISMGLGDKSSIREADEGEDEEDGDKTVIAPRM